MERNDIDGDVLGRRTVLGILAATAAGAVGCTPDAPTSLPPPTVKSTGKNLAPKALKLAVIPKGMTHEFWKSVNHGAIQASMNFSPLTIEWKGPNEERDVQGQIEIVKNMIVMGVDGIILAPVHSESLVDVVKEAEAAGIPTLIFDSALSKDASIVSYVATDNFHGGELAAETLAKAIGEKGNVIMLRYTEGSESTEQREAGFLKKIAEYPDVKVLSSDQFAGTSIQAAQEKANQMLLKYQDEVNGIFGVCESNCNGILEALEQSGQSGKVKFVAFDPSDRLIDGLMNGKVDGIVLQDPDRMGYDSVRLLAAKLRGEEVPEKLSTGEHVATPDNVETDIIRRLLNPPIAEGGRIIESKGPPPAGKKGAPPAGGSPPGDAAPSK
jgi:ribose transport system substrate-binding protein